MIERGYIDNGESGQIHFAQTGTGIPVLLLHQTPRSWDEFREVMQQCDNTIHCIAMDLPGMGASSPTREPPTIEAFADAAIRLIESFDCDSIVVCGHHTGGVVAIDIAARRPNLVRSLLLSSTPWVDRAARVQRRDKTPIDTVSRSRDGSHLIDLWRQRDSYYPKHPETSVEYMDRFMASALQADGPERGHHAVGRYEMELAAPRIHCPTLIVEHMADPFATRHTADLQRAFPHADFEQIPKGGVALEATAPQFADILQRWVCKTDYASQQTP
ncbi:MAG: alpha/beta fold hydrolase [Congregibacter sp.]